MLAEEVHHTQKGQHVREDERHQNVRRQIQKGDIDTFANADDEDVKRISRRGFPVIFEVLAVDRIEGRSGRGSRRRT